MIHISHKIFLEDIIVCIIVVIIALAVCFGMYLLLKEERKREVDKKRHLSKMR